MGLNAEQARKAEAREVRRIARERARQSRLDQAKALKDCRWAMKVLYPEDLKKIQKDIKDQIKLRAEHYHVKREVTFSMPTTGRRHDAYLKQLKKDLPGFTFHETHHPAEWHNMGDFNAPCNIESPAHWVLHIGWEK